jgi:toxin HigB-1
VIRTYRCKDTEALFNDKPVSRFHDVERTARRKLVYLNVARKLQDLRNPPGNRLESLSGDREGQFSIRINEKWRLCFRWDDGDVHDVEIVDYH